MSLFPLKATSTYVKAYYAALARFQLHGHTTEGNTRSAFSDLMKKCASPYDWHLVEEYTFKVGKKSLRADGAIFHNELPILHGLWEAKDTDDKLHDEIKKKFAAGYPLTNILFQSPTHAVLYQGSRKPFDGPIDTPEALVEVLTLFFDYLQPHEADWEAAVTKFSVEIPKLAQGVTDILDSEYKKNADFRTRFQAFAELCKQSINPDLTDPAIQKMLVQHLLTERVFRKVFDNNEFLQRNVIAIEIEKVIKSITSKHFSRDTFLKPLDRFYTTIEAAATQQTGYTEKQHFLNAVYEKFFQSFDKNQADTHGIVYTPQPIVDFMVRSVEEVLKNEFGKSLSDEGVHILDPFTGTGNFITRIMRSIKKSRLPQKYANELHCNEIMLLPYYIASMNIEHAYSEALLEYKAFSGICLVDTFELAESDQATLFTAENTQRVLTQKSAPVHVVIGNPPYNAWKSDEATSTKNRYYKQLSKRIKATYAHESKASLLISLNDPYINAYRWASDRIGAEGVVAFVSNSSFLDSIATDGMRASLMREFDAIYLVDLGGNIRQNPRLSGTTHNVFGIQVGVVIAILVRRKTTKPHRLAKLSYFAVDPDWKRSAKLQLLSRMSYATLKWRLLKPNAKNDWLTEGLESGFQDFTALRPAKRASQVDTVEDGIFAISSSGVKTNRDNWVYNFDPEVLMRNVSRTVDFYNAQIDRFKRTAVVTGRSAFTEALASDQTRISWSDDLRVAAKKGNYTVVDEGAVRPAIYRPFCRENLYFDRLLNNSVYLLAKLYPQSETVNPSFWVKTGGDWPFFVLMVKFIADVLPQGGSQLFSFFSFDKDGVRRENITDWALAQYRTHYADKKITKWDIFHSTYALLHHPEYRTRYAANLKRELPRIPFPPDLRAFAKAGKRLMELHIDYEKQPEYPLEEVEIPKVAWSLRVERMRLNPKDKTELRYNEALTLRGIPPAAFDYRLGNRSALEWVIDQYQVSTDARSGIVNDPNRPDDERYILRLIGQVITVSLDTQQIIAALPSLNLGDKA